jgi:hypothetical protein
VCFCLIKEWTAGCNIVERRGKRMATKVPMQTETMSSKANGQQLPFLGAGRFAVLDHVQRRERRSCVRSKLRWSVLLRDRHGESLESVTENLSSHGFHCLCPAPFSCGELLLCWLTVPTHDPSGTKKTMVLECDVRVVRTEAAPVEGMFGVACRIEGYRFACG